MEDDEGSKYNLSLEGNISREKIIKIIELMESVKNNNNESLSYNKDQDIFSENSIDSKIWRLIERELLTNTFTSTDLQNIYEKTYRESIKLSIVSTYLSRYCDKGKLFRSKRNREYVYKLSVDLENKNNNNIQSKNFNLNSSFNNSLNTSYNSKLFQNDSTIKKTVNDLQN